MYINGEGLADPSGRVSLRDDEVHVGGTNRVRNISEEELARSIRVACGGVGSPWLVRGSWRAGWLVDRFGVTRSRLAKEGVFCLAWLGELRALRAVFAPPTQRPWPR